MDAILLKIANRLRFERVLAKEPRLRGDFCRVELAEVRSFENELIFQTQKSWVCDHHMIIKIDMTITATNVTINLQDLYASVKLNVPIGFEFKER